MRSRFSEIVRALPLAHQVLVGVAVLALALGALALLRWVSTPSYTLLYSNLDDTALAEVVDRLEQDGVSYRIEAGGSRVLVAQGDVHRVRARLAAAGIEGTVTPPGFELLDGQGLSVSDFRQRVDYQRALEGEMARTLTAIEVIDSAQVHLVIPEEPLFAEDEKPVTASVLVATTRELTAGEVETVTFLVASSVEGLEPGDVTVADVDGRVLQAAGQQDERGAIGNRNLRLTREYEAALAADVRRLLDTAAGAAVASVVVRAQLDFDEQSTESETYVPESAVTTREQTIDETFTGAGAPPGGTVGVDGEIQPVAGEDYDYARSEATREFGVDRTVVRTVTAPGAIESLSVAVVIDDGSLTGAAVPPAADVEELVSAAIGLDTGRGDTLAVTTVAFPAPEAEAEEAEPAAGPAAGLNPLDLIPQAVGAVVLFVVAAALLMMSRSGRRKPSPQPALEASGAEQPALPGGLPDERSPALVGAPTEAPAGEGSLRPEVVDLVQRQPEEIAVLLRSWLADRR